MKYAIIYSLRGNKPDIWFFYKTKREAVDEYRKLCDEYPQHNYYIYKLEKEHNGNPKQN